MSTWGLIQFVADIFLFAGIFVIIMRLNRAPKDDPRLSRGLQLLQSKISVLEDLSDRTETQVGQLTAILENKAREVQAKVQLAEQHVHEIRVSMERSLEVAKIFQDKIPHKEIIERQSTIKYVTAARLAHKGSSIDEICAQIDLPRGEIEFIASVNRDRLMFTEDQLPEWVKVEANPTTAQETAFSTNSGFTSGEITRNYSFIEETPSSLAANAEENEAQAQHLRAEMELAEQQRLIDNLSRLQFEMQNLDSQLAREGSHRDFSSAFEVPVVETDSLKRLGEEFRKAVVAGGKADATTPFPPLEQISPLLKQAAASIAKQMAPYPQDNAPETTPRIIVPAPAQMSYDESFDAHVAKIKAAREAAAHASMQNFAPAANEIAEQADAAANSPLEAPISAAEKVRAAMKPRVPVGQSSKQVSPELAAARTLAKETKARETLVQPGPKPTHIVGGKPAKAGAAEPVIRRVMFPRIDDPQT